MSIYSFVGILTGMVVTMLLWLGMQAFRWRRGDVQDDERTQAIKGGAASAAMWVTGAVLFIGWVVDNLWTYYQGGSIHFFTPWSIMLLVLVTTYSGAYSYFYHKNSADETDEAAIAQKRKAANLNMSTGLYMLFLSFTDTVQRDSGLRYLMLTMAVLTLAVSAYVHLRFRRRAGGGH